MRYSTGTEAYTARLRLRGYPRSAEEIARHFDLAYRQTADAVVVASWDWPQDPQHGQTSLPPTVTS